MEAARVAALRGHAVTLVEARPRLGGRWAYAAATSAPNAQLLAWLERQVAETGVDVRLGESVDAAAVAALEPDAVIVATGGAWPVPDVDGADLPHVFTPDALDGWLLRDEALAGAPVRGRAVAVLGGDLPGLGLAEHAHAAGAQVTVVDATPVFGTHLGLPGRWQRVAELRSRGIALVGGAEVRAITADAVHTADLDGEHAIPAELVFVTSSITPGAALAEELRGSGLDVQVVGDAADAGLLEGAMLGGLEAGVSL
jgi:NADPH-dependent 2,4-dienoyl-CoA reductase/sulfur reductase-like enzyme